MGAEPDDEWNPYENHGQATDPDTRVSQNGNVNSSMADDDDREESGQ